MKNIKKKLNINVIHFYLCHNTLRSSFKSKHFIDSWIKEDLLLNTIIILFVLKFSTKNYKISHRMEISRIYNYEKSIISSSNNCVRNCGAYVCIVDFVGYLFTLHILFENLFASILDLFTRKYLDVNTKLIPRFPIFLDRKAWICRKCASKY